MISDLCVCGHECGNHYPECRYGCQSYCKSFTPAHQPADSGEERLIEVLGIDPDGRQVTCGDCGEWVSVDDAIAYDEEETVRCRKCAEPTSPSEPTDSGEDNLEMDAGAGASDYSHSLIFTSSKFVVTAFGRDREHCEDVLQCVLLGRFKDHDGDREHRATEPICDCGVCNTCLHPWNNYPTTYGESK